MARWLTYQAPVDAGLFTPLGLQPSAVCRLGFNAAGVWLSRHAISHRRLIAEHRTGLVVWSAQLRFEEPVGFFDGDHLQMRVSGRLRGGGTQFQTEVDIDGELGATTRLTACCVPLRLDGGAALAGVPAQLSGEVMAAFRPDEIDLRPHRSPAPALRATIEREGTLLARGRTSFVIHRHQCEVADQWFWPEAVSLAAAGREDLIQEEAETISELRSSLRTPIRRLDLLFNRPFFLFDEGAVLTTAHRWGALLVFIHELAAPDENRPRALVMEQFRCV